MLATTDPQPARLTIDYPDREPPAAATSASAVSLDRISTLLRLVYVLPIAVVLGLVGTAASGESLGALAGGVLVLPVLLTSPRGTATAVLAAKDRHGAGTP